MIHESRWILHLIPLLFHQEAKLVDFSERAKSSNSIYDGCRVHKVVTIRDTIEGTSRTDTFRLRPFTMAHNVDKNSRRARVIRHLFSSYVHLTKVLPGTIRKIKPKNFSHNRSHGRYNILKIST